MLRILTILPLMLVPATAGAQEINELKGEISGYECGDNCYLNVDFGAAGWLSALCVAEACMPWNEAVAIPEELIGRKVTVVVGVGDQFQGGDIPVPYIAFTSVTLEE